MLKYRSLGIPLIDDLLPQGIPVGSVIGIMGPPGTGKTILTFISIKETLKKSEPVVYVALDDDPSTIVSELEALEIDMKSALSKKLFLIIDCYSSLGVSARLQYSDLVRQAIVSAAEPSKPPDILNKLLIALKDFDVKGGLLVIDSLNEIMTKSDPSRVLDFIKGLKLITRRHEMIGIVSIHTKIPGFEQLEEMLKFTLDGIIELSIDESFAQVGIPLRKLRVVRIKNAPHSLTWIPYTISQGTILPVDVKALMESLRKMVEELRASLPKGITI